MAPYESSRLGDGSAWMQEAWERRVPVKGVNAHSGCQPRGRRLRPASAGSASHACSSLSAHSDSDAAAGWGFRPRPFGLTGSSAMNSAQENSIYIGQKVMNSVQVGRKSGPVLKVDRTIFEMWLGAL